MSLCVSKEEIEELKIKVKTTEDFVNEARHHNIPDTDLDEIHLAEEQLHYMRGYLRLMDIRFAREARYDHSK